jgi:hypothetical protein
MKRELAVCWDIKVFLISGILEITGGNAEVAENKGNEKRAIRKLMLGKRLKIDRSAERGIRTSMGKQ